MVMPDTPTLPQRVEGFDLARGLAVFGMVLVNFKFVMGLEGVDTGLLGQWAGLFDGRSAATFVTLAGIGVSLLSQKARESQDSSELSRCRSLLLKRALFLLGAGFLDSFLWIGDILHFYAAYLLIAALLLNATGRRLWGIATASIAVFVALFIFLDYEKGWDWEALTYAGFWMPRGVFRHLFFNGFHPVFPWIAFLLVGMWLGRRDLSEPLKQRRLFGWGLGATVLAEGLSAVLAPWAASDGGEDGAWCALLFGTQSMPPTPLYLISGGGSAAALIAACLYVSRRCAGSRVLKPLEDAGRMALTIYAGHVIFGLWALEKFELIEDKSIGFALVSSVMFYASAVLFAWAWSKRFSRGPLEGLMRRISG